MPTKPITATERVLFSHRPLVVELPAIGAIARCMLFSVQASVNENIAPKLKPVEKMRAALYVLQGANDPRVPQSEAEQIVQAVRKRGSDVWYMLATDEGHGFNKKPNRDYAQMTALMFLEKHLGAPSTSGTQGGGASGSQ